jgi:Zn-dependent protease with chaperone function
MAAHNNLTESANADARVPITDGTGEGRLLLNDASPQDAILPRPSMVVLDALTILLILTSYIFVVVMAAACVLVPLFLVIKNTAMGSADAYGWGLLAAFGVVVALLLLWSLVPRRQKFRPPGVLLDRSFQPHLFAELDSIAASLGEALPGEVYLTDQANAAVADRGGIVGAGSRRVMGLGLPLLAVLSVSQFRAILAHEFAHYYRGDTRLGPWVAMAQMAFVRTLQQMRLLGGVQRNILLQMMVLPVTAYLEFYFTIFLGATRLVSRQREFRADELACLIAGKQPLVDGLRMLHAVPLYWRAYWHIELMPALRNGDLPPIEKGFAQWLTAPGMPEQVEGAKKWQIENAKTGPYDTHPALRERIAAIQKLSGCPAIREDTRPARELVEGLETAEQRLIETLYPHFSGNLRPAAWREAMTKTRIAAWRESVSKHSELLAGITIGMLPDAIRRLPEIGSKIPGIPGPKGMMPTPEMRARNLLDWSLALKLVGIGWQLEAQPGHISFQRRSDQFDPYRDLGKLISGKMSAEDWRSECHKVGISDLSLCPEGPQSQSDVGPAAA